MTHSYLLEIGLEEMPAKIIKMAENQLENNVVTFLSEVELSYDSLEIFSTPRRLAVKIDGLDERQPDKSELIKGPAKRIAVDEDGNWTKAAGGFSKGQGADPSDIVFKELKGEEYAYIEKYTEGKTADKVLEGIITAAQSINFPISMKWSTNTKRYIRPVHWLVSLLDSKVIPLEMFGVTASNQTRGHRFLGGEITLDNPEEYASKLEADYVIANREKRKGLIKEQITELCEKQGWLSPLYNESLLNEVTDLVEYPTAFYGSFEERFLDVPENVLETSMADHQRYFPVRKDNETQEFLPYFIGVRNGNSDYLSEVVRGNEKVLVARLEDAKFFYEEDKKVSIEESVEKLKDVNYQEKLGSLYDKQLRVKQIAKTLAGYFDLSEESKKHLERATEIYKFDLVTQIVGEFTDLQGEIGTIYAEEKGEHPEVAEAIEQQYMPVSSTGKLPYTKVGTILAMAEKIDTLLLFFAIGLIPTGSNDPFALRRSAIGLIRIIRDNNLSFPFKTLSREDIEILDIDQSLKDGYYEHEKEFIKFIKERINNQIKSSDKNIAYDIRQAVLESTDEDIQLLYKKAELLNDEKDTNDYKLVEESLTRLANLVKKNVEFTEVNESLFETESEKALYDKIKDTQLVFDKEDDVEGQYGALTELAPYISDFFDNNMVNSDDKQVRLNRLSLLREVHKLAIKFADFSQLVV